jgi:hypothetical protein
MGEAQQSLAGHDVSRAVQGTGKETADLSAPARDDKFVRELTTLLRGKRIITGQQICHLEQQTRGSELEDK